jgi:hypothetical protein
VWWVRAERREPLLNDLIELGARFIPGLNEGKVQEREEAARAALDYLSQAGFEKPWLIDYGNVAEPAAIDKLTPRTGAHVLITTRWADWYGHAAKLPVDVFTPEVVVGFLMAHARRGDALAAASLAADLGHLPLSKSMGQEPSMSWPVAPFVIMWRRVGDQPNRLGYRLVCGTALD